LSQTVKNLLFTDGWLSDIVIGSVVFSNDATCARTDARAEEEKKMTFNPSLVDQERCRRLLLLLLRGLLRREMHAAQA